MRHLLETRGQLCGVGSLHVPTLCEFWRWNLGCQAWQVLLPAKALHWPHLPCCLRQGLTWGLTD